MQDGGSQGMDHEQQHVLKIRLEMKILGPPWIYWIQSSEGELSPAISF